jgi:hypothetical protein
MNLLNIKFLNLYVSFHKMLRESCYAWKVSLQPHDKWKMHMTQYDKVDETVQLVYWLGYELDIWAFIVWSPSR